MATRKKTSFSLTAWLRKLRQRLCSRAACFVWGALFGNAVLSQPIQPLNLLLGPPEHMLSATARQWLAEFRSVLYLVSTQITQEALQALPTPIKPPPAPPTAPVSDRDASLP